MTIGCNILGHVARSTHHQNQGIDFTLCHRCGEDLIRVHGDWAVVPKGMRVVWREKTARRLDAASVAQRIALPETPRAAKKRALPVPTERRKRRARPLHAAHALAGVVSGMLASSIADKLRDRGGTPSPASAPPPVIYLPARTS